MRAARWSSVAVAVLFLAGCGQTRAQTHGSTLRLTEKDNSHSFTVAPSTPIVVTLASNRYPSEYLPDSGSGRYLRLVSHRHVPPTPSRAGAAGKEIWRFRAIAKVGSVDITLASARVGEWIHYSQSFTALIHVR